MSLSPPPTDVRRGGRVRKQVEKFEVPAGLATQKGKKKQSDAEQDDEDSDLTEEGSEVEVDVNEAGPAQKRRQTAKSKKSRSTEGQKKKAKKLVAAEAQNGDEVEGIKQDSPFFNALLSPDIALQPLVDEWVEGYLQAAGDEASEQASVAELVLFFLRCCGLNWEIEQAEALDVDGIADVIERIQDESVRVALASYPLISRTKELRPFKNNLNHFIELLISALSLTPLLFHTDDTTIHSTPLAPLLSNWLSCMSTSPLRPIRHTSTYILLKVNTALCDVAATVSKDLSLKQRQKEAEIKKGGTTAAAQKRVKDAEVKVKEAHARKQQLEELMKEVFDVMFVHRVRDADPAIRTDCLRELGLWAKKYPEYYVTTSFLTYFTRGCNDISAHARLETARALVNLYSKDSFINNARTVTMRLAPRLIEMALRDVDLNVRVTAIHVISAIDQTGILADEDEGQREKLARLIYDPEFRIRKAMGKFIFNLWEEKKEELKNEWSGARAAKKKRAAKISADAMATNLDWKALASLLVDTSRSLDEPASSTSAEQTLIHLDGTTILTRANAAVESICSEHELWKDWEGLVDYLLLDHSTADDDMWLLTEEEETFMLEVLMALIAREDQDEDEDEDARTKTLIKVLPRLFAKHHADPAKMTGILSIPKHMKLSLYHDVRMGTAYNALWDEISKQFLQHTNPAVLITAIEAVNQLSQNSDMDAANNTKLAELQESLFASLRDAIGENDVALLSLEEEGLAQLEAIMLRLSLLQKSRNLVEIMEDIEGGQSSGWDIVCAFAERGRLGYKEEAKIVEYAIEIAFLHLTWLYSTFTQEDPQDEEKVSSLSEKRDKAVEIFQDLTLRDATNTVESVRRQACIAYLNTHVLFFARKGNDRPAATSCPLKIEDEIQHRLGGAFQAAVEKYASERYVAANDEGEDAENVVGKTDGELLHCLWVLQFEEDLPFLRFTAVFVAAIRVGVLEVEHAKEPLARYGRFGASYDGIVKKLVDVLRDEGLYNKEADTVQHVAGAALQQSFNLFLDSDAEEPTATLSLAKLVANAFVITGNHFAVLREMHPNDVIDFHIEGIDFISRRVGTLINSERAARGKDAKARAAKRRFLALSYFRALLVLLGPIRGGTHALKIKNHLDDVIAAIGIDVTSNKGWDGYRAYEKKLVSIASKDPEVKMLASRKVIQGTEERDDTEIEGDDDREETPTRVVPSGSGRARSNTLIRENGSAHHDRSSPAPPPSRSNALNRKRPRDAAEEEQDAGPELDVEDHGNDISVQLELGSDLGDGNAGEDANGNDELGDGTGVEMEVDLENELSLDNVVVSQRERSVSVEPSIKRRRTVKKH
ncbi:cohesin complex subunit SA-1/2 [Kwoniella heveanensis BCC8398]|uniref:Cohesin complex subunit SA-1/2 n=1 Tax=Kwoniella heveanensis BCC8398 TaxID=1296120 RepID=A0A1B9GTR2_9TREE|nr:cohesin complex subunit SA-1/2 [Kwoniella heveanensis BCC8398]